MAPRWPEDEAERVADELMNHAHRVAAELGEPLTSEEALNIIKRTCAFIPDPEFSVLVAEKATEKAKELP